MDVAEGREDFERDESAKEQITARSLDQAPYTGVTRLLHIRLRQRARIEKEHTHQPRLTRYLNFSQKLGLRIGSRIGKFHFVAGRTPMERR